MKWIDNLKTSLKLFGGFGILVVMMLVIAGEGYLSINSINNGLASLYFDQTLPIRDMGLANATLYKMRGDVFKFVYIPESRAETRESIAADEQTIKELMDAYRAGQLGEKGKRLWQNLTKPSLFIKPLSMKS